MEEKDLITKIQRLKAIKPRENWVSLTKEEIFPKESRVSVFEVLSKTFYTKPAFVFAVLGIMILTFGFAQSSLPGDVLYNVKKITENTKISFSSKIEKPGAHLELANKRLEDLNKISETNKVKNLAPTIIAFQDSISDAVKDLNKLEKDGNVIKEIISQTKKLEENKERMQALGIVIGETRELDNALAQLVEREINDLKDKTLTEEQIEVFNQIQEDYEAGLYSKALESILFLSQ